MIRKANPGPILEFPGRSTPKEDASDWPLPDYVRAWKMFRGVSNEAEVISRHISGSQWYLARERPIALLDVGPGDGEVLKRFLLERSVIVRKLLIAEPDRGFLAECRVKLSPFDLDAEYLEKKIEDIDSVLLHDIDMVIYCHVAYFTGAAPLQYVLSQLRPGASCFVIFDEENSVFSKLWQRTADQRYLDRVREARRAIENLDSQSWNITRTTVQTKLRDPATLSSDIAVFVKSLLCYSDYRDLAIEDAEWVDAVVKTAAKPGFIQCTSDCFEIVRR